MIKLIQIKNVLYNVKKLKTISLIEKKNEKIERRALQFKTPVKTIEHKKYLKVIFNDGWNMDTVLHVYENDKEFVEINNFYEKYKWRNF